MGPLYSDKLNNQRALHSGIGAGVKDNSNLVNVAGHTSIDYSDIAETVTSDGPGSSSSAHGA